MSPRAPPVTQAGGPEADAAANCSREPASGCANVAELLKPLSCPDQHVRQAACQNLAKCDGRSDPRVLTALTQRLQQDRDAYVRQAAASALGQATKRGDEAVLQVIQQRATGDADAGVRRLACIAASQIAPRGHAATVGVLLSRLEDRDSGVRRSATKALEKVAERCDVQVISALLTRTGDPEAFVRHHAVEALGKLADEGFHEVVDRLLELVHSDRDPRVRWSCTDGLGKLASRGDNRVLSALMGRLEDDADCVRRAAACALGKVTLAPLQELEVHERHIAELEMSQRSELTSLQVAMHRMREAHAEEASSLKRRITELEDQLVDRDARIEHYEAQLDERNRFLRFGDFLPCAAAVTRFLDTLPALAGMGANGMEIIAPVWALRCVRATPSTGSGNNNPRGGAPNSSRLLDETSPSNAGKDKRDYLELFEMFEQLSSGKTTTMELTESKPLDVYIHKGEDDAFGLYCCSRHRLLALLMFQATCRNECLMVRCIVRSKDDCGYWGWHWNSFYDGGDGLTVNVSPKRSSGSTASLGFGFASVRDSLFSPVSGQRGLPTAAAAFVAATSSASSRSLSQPSGRTSRLARGSGGGGGAGAARAALASGGTGGAGSIVGSASVGSVGSAGVMSPSGAGASPNGDDCSTSEQRPRSVDRRCGGRGRGCSRNSFGGGGSGGPAAAGRGISGGPQGHLQGHPQLPQRASPSSPVSPRGPRALIAASTAAASACAAALPLDDGDISPQEAYPCGA